MQILFFIILKNVCSNENRPARGLETGCKGTKKWANGKIIAMKILGWDKGPLGVAKSEGGNRMNEVKVHGKWAKKISILADIYGIKEDV